MTKPWKLKKNSSNILLVLITLILVKAEWATGHFDQARESGNSVEEHESRTPGVQVYVGNDEIAQFFFRSSADNTSLVLDDVNRCLDNFQLVTCLKMLLLDRVNVALSFLEEPNVKNENLRFLNGFLVFKRTNDTNATATSENSEDLSLDEEISRKVIKMFRNRSLQVNLFSRMKLDIEPAPPKKTGDFVCFRYKLYKEVDSVDPVDGDGGESGQSRGRKRKGGGMSMMTMLPQLLMLGFMPFTLASLKAMVMNAVMINMMALNGAIFMTIRNLVFGPRSGDNVKYVNYGYSKDRQTQSPRPVLIIHSPAAFVKQPQVRKRPPHFHPKKQIEIHVPESELSSSSQIHYKQNYNTINYNDDNYYVVQQTGTGHDDQYQSRRRWQTVQNRNHRVTQNPRNRNSNKKVNAYQRTTSKPDVRIIPSHQRHNNNNFSRGDGFGKQVSQVVPAHKYTGAQPERRHSIKAKRDKTEFRPSPQWDPMEVIRPTSNSTNAGKADRYRNHRYENVE